MQYKRQLNHDKKKTVLHGDIMQDKFITNTNADP